MRTKKALIALSTALVLFGATAALANDNGANSGETGGIKIGPLGQDFSSGQVKKGWNTYGYAAPSYGYAAPSHHATRKHTVRPASK